MRNDVIIHQEKNGIQYIQFKKLLEYPEIEHCYTIRENNINFRVYENDDILQMSYDKICEVLDFNRNNIIKPHQTHTDRAEIVQNGQEKLNEVDGVLTNKSDIALCTTSADCTSILLYDPVNRVIGDVHSGWRGTIQKIVQKAVRKMIEQYSCKPENIIACICPHIRKCHFEVEEDVMQLFADTFSNMEDIMIKGDIVEGVQKYFVDTTKINMQLLEQVGLQQSNIIDSGICTVCEKEYFHSYRTDKEKSGRNGAMIMLK